MRRRDAEIISNATGEAIPDWLKLDKDVVVEGVGDIIVREEDDGTWTVVRSVDGAEPEADRGHPSEAVALRLAKAYSEGGKIIIERRTSKEVEAAGIHKGMIAKYGEDDITITSVSGNDVKILFPSGDELDIDVTQLSEVREAQDVGVPPMTGETPPDMALAPGAMPGMMAGEEYDEEEEEERKLLEKGRELIRKWEELEEKEALEDEEELGGASIGPPVYFVEIEPLPGQRQSPLGASKIAAVYMSQEKGDPGRERRVDVQGILDLYKSIGIPLQRTARRVKIGGIFLVSDADSDTYRLEEELINGEIRPLTKDMARDEAEVVMEAHTDLSQGTVSELVGQAKESGSLFLGDRLGYLVQADVLLSPTEDMTGFVLTQDGMVIEGPMDEEQARETLRRATSLMDESIERAIEFASAGHSPRIANVKIAKEAPVCKKCHQRHWPFQPCPGTGPEKEKPAGRGEEKAEEKEAAQEKTSGKVRMYFDWDEFFTDVMPQLSNSDFQQAFDSTLGAAWEEEEKGIHDEEALLFGREARRRGLPHPYDVVFGPDSRVALASEPSVQGDVEEYRFKDNEIDYLVNLASGSSIWFKESELKPTTNPDTTTTPWTDRSKKITDPENKRQTSDFLKDLKQKTGQEEGIEYTLSDEAAEGIAISVVNQLVTESDIREAAAEDPGLQPGDIALNLDTDIRNIVEKDYYEEHESDISDPDLNLVVAYATNYIASMFPRPPGEFASEYAMKVGAPAKIVSGYETDDAELQILRDRKITGKVVELNATDAAVAFGDSVLLIGRKDLEVVGNFFRRCTIRKCAPADRDPKKPASDQVWCLYTKQKPERVLGRHKTKPEAIQQEKAVKAQGERVRITAEVAVGELEQAFGYNIFPEQREGVEGFLAEVNSFLGDFASIGYRFEPTPEQVLDLYYALGGKLHERHAPAPVADRDAMWEHAQINWQEGGEEAALAMAIKARGGSLFAQGAEICPEFVERSLKDEQEGAKGYREMSKEVPPGSPEQRALENMAKDEESHAKILEKWKREEASLTREAPRPEGEPAPKDRAISAPPGAPSRGRPRREEPPEVCVCPITGKEYPKERGVECSAKESPEHPGVRMVSKPRAGVPPIPPGAPPRELKSSSYRVAQEDVMQAGEDVAYSVASDILESMDPGLHQDMVRRYPEVDPNFFISEVLEAAPVKADDLLPQYAAQYENSEAVLEVAVGRLADVVYSMVEEEASIPAETMALRKTAENVRSYADCLVERVQAGVITAGDALKELREEAKQWDWTTKQKKYVKDRLQGKIAEKYSMSHEKALTILDELEARVLPIVKGALSPFDSGRAPAQDSVSGGGVKARGSFTSRVAQVQYTVEDLETVFGYEFHPEQGEAAGRFVEAVNNFLSNYARVGYVYEPTPEDVLESYQALGGRWDPVAEPQYDAGTLWEYAMENWPQPEMETVAMRLGQQDIATLLKELPRAQAQSLIRTLDDPSVLSAVLEGLGRGDDTNDARQWLLSAPGASEGLLAMYAEDPDPSNRLLGLREMGARYPGADLSPWFEDPFPYIAQEARDLQPGEEPREGLPEVPVPASFETTSVPLAGEARQTVPILPGAPPPEFPEQPESPEEEKEEGRKRPVRKRRKRGAIGVPKQLMLTYDELSEQFVMCDPDYGTISPEGAREKEIRGQLQAFRVQDDIIGEALKAAKKGIVQIRIAQGAFGDVQELIKDAVQAAVTQLSPGAPRANLMMVAMDELAKVTSAEDARQLQNQIKEVLNSELEMYPRPEIPGTNQEFTQIAEDSVKTGHTYEDEAKKERIRDLEKHGIPLQMKFEKAPPEDIPPNRLLSTIAESRFGFTVSDRVRDQAMPELTGVIDSFGIGNIVRVAMDPSIYNPEGGIGIYSLDGLIKIS